MKNLIIGNLTKDENVTESGIYRGAGGSSYFAGKILSNFGDHVTILSPRGKDFPSSQTEGITLHPKEPKTTHTLTFRNVMTQKGRVQEVLYEENAGVYRPENIPILETDVVIIAPLVDNMDNAFIQSVTEKFPHTLKVFLPQGLFRTVASDGKVVIKRWQGARDVVSNVQIIVYSREDMVSPDEVASNWSCEGTIVVVTKDKDGCSVYIKGKRTDIQAIAVDTIVDSTGAGDIFAASFTHRYAINHDAIDAAKFANTIASQSLHFYPNQLSFIIRQLADSSGQAQNVWKMI